VVSPLIITLVANIGSPPNSQPIHGFWDKTIPFHCISGDNILIVPGGFNAVLDAFVVLLVSTTHKRVARQTNNALKAFALAVATSDYS
jgi:hypothetical protein